MSTTSKAKTGLGPLAVVTGLGALGGGGDWVMAELCWSLV